MFNRVENRLLAKGLKYWAHCCSQPTNWTYKILDQKIHLLVAAYRGYLERGEHHNGAFVAKILNRFKLLTIYAKKAPSQMFNRVENRLLAKGLKYWAHCCSQPTNWTYKILDQKICVISFLKMWQVMVGQ